MDEPHVIPADSGVVVHVHIDMLEVGAMRPDDPDNDPVKAAALAKFAADGYLVTNPDDLTIIHDGASAIVEARVIHMGGDQTPMAGAKVFAVTDGGDIVEFPT